ncbi:hypothetical protein EMPG_12105 [Blastomyces silverae]|uniref:Uncharacterized protein n=1 Tax=Blastomyces silverae TaxID=2060906 RepID=A0A0H1BPA7_9EURO|nr:hypothetical protein EMPG_12105 [Blastomyces silverae]
MTKRAYTKNILAYDLGQNSDWAGGWYLRMLPNWQEHEVPFPSPEPIKNSATAEDFLRETPAGSRKPEDIGCLISANKPSKVPLIVLSAISFDLGLSCGYASSQQQSAIVLSAHTSLGCCIAFIGSVPSAAPRPLVPLLPVAATFALPRFAAVNASSHLQERSVDPEHRKEKTAWFSRRCFQTDSPAAASASRRQSS